MHLQFNKKYVNRSNTSVSMIVANGVEGDSRVIKIASTLCKLGYSVYLYGVSKTPHNEKIEGYPFSIELIGNPSFNIKAAGRHLIENGKRNISLFIDQFVDALSDLMQGKCHDILHTHDMYGLPIGARLKETVLPSSTPWIHDLHEYVKGCTNIDEHVRITMLKFEQQYISKPDALTTVSPILSKLISQDYGVPEPSVILNTPRAADFDPWYPRPIRKAIGLDSSAPLVVYNGNVKSIRGVHVAVEALGFLPDIHLALVTNSKGNYIKELIALAESKGAADRLHIHPYVPNQEVTSFLRDVNVGVNPVSLYENSDLALPNKIFEYIHSGIPIVSTPTSALTDFLKKNRLGVTFQEGNAIDLAKSIEFVLEKYPNGLSNAGPGSQLARKYSWEAQEKILDKIYAHLIPTEKNMTKKKGEASNSLGTILHLPTFAANQPKTLSNGLRQIGEKSYGVSIVKSNFNYKTDHTLAENPHSVNSFGEYLRDPVLSDAQVFHFHARPLLYKGDLKFPTGLDLLLLKGLGKNVFFHFRGSEARLNSVFASRNPYNFLDDKTYQLDIKKPFIFNEPSQIAFINFVQAICDGVLVPDAELQTYVHNALIVPRAIDIDPSFSLRSSVSKVTPLIIHAPSRRGVKGTKYILDAADRLKAEGYKFNFRLIEDIPHDEALKLYRKADIVIDQLRVGWYGVLAVEAMALGKAVISYVRSDLRHYLPDPAPLAIANTDNIERVIRYFLDNPDEITRHGERGLKYVKQYHCSKTIAKTLSYVYKYKRKSASLDPVSVSEFFDVASKFEIKKNTSNVISKIYKLVAYRPIMLAIRKIYIIASNEGLLKAARFVYERLKRGL